MKREIIRPFSVWDRELCSQVELSVGTVVSHYRIVRALTSPDEPYGVKFQSSGRHYSCALHTFLPRTQSIPVLEVPALEVPALRTAPRAVAV